MSQTVKIIECPRDAWQSLPKDIPTLDKVRYLRSLIDAGFDHIDAVSFVSELHSPQMADSELVLDRLSPPDDVEIIGLVTNAHGAERAARTRCVTTLAFPYSISPAYLDRAQNQTPNDALEELEQIGEIAYKAGLDIVAYVPMAFGNPFGDAWDIDEVVSAVDLLVDAGVLQVSLADTAGTADAGLIHAVMSCVTGVHEDLEIGLHLNTRPEQSKDKITAAYQAGCRRFDGVITGLGGYAEVQDERATNLRTELLLDTLRSLGAKLPPLRPLDSLITASRGLGRRFGA